MNIWKENKKEESKMTGIYLDLETAKKLAQVDQRVAQGIKQLNKTVKKVQERSKDECKK